LKLRHEIEKQPLVAGDGFKQIGSTLKDARLSQGLSIKDISEQLRISVDFLTKLEAGSFNELPAPAYVVGFLRSYGRCVGLAPDPLVARYMAVTQDEGSAKPSYKTPMSTRPPQRSAPAVASVLVLFGLMAYGGWFWLKTNDLPVLDVIDNDTKTAELLLSPDRQGALINASSLDAPAKIDRVLDNLADTGEVSVNNLSTERTIKPLGSALNTIVNRETDRSETELASNEKLALEPVEIGSSMYKTRLPEPAKSDLTVGEAQILSPSKSEPSNQILTDELVERRILAARDPASLDLLNSNRAIANLRDPAKEITIRAVAASWVEIVRDNGEEVLAKLMQAGDSYVVEGNTRLFLSTGNAGGLTVVIGTDDPLSMGDIGEIVRDLPLVTEKLRKSL
jgi:cytoskeleton protein RodZ